MNRKPINRIEITNGVKGIAIYFDTIEKHEKENIICLFLNNNLVSILKFKDFKHKLRIDRYFKQCKNRKYYELKMF